MNNNDGKFSDGILAKNGLISFIPTSSNKVLKFDPANHDNPLTEIGYDLELTGRKYGGRVFGKDGNIYCTPFIAHQVLRIDVDSDKTSFMGDEHEGEGKWGDRVVAKDGNIDVSPLLANQILQIHTKNQTTSLVGPILGGSLKWISFVEGKDGLLNVIPTNANNLLRFDPIVHTTILIPLNQNLVGDQK